MSKTSFAIITSDAEEWRRRMKIIEKINEKSKDLNGRAPITIACFGDSVTQGCFDLYLENETTAKTYFNAEQAYHTHLRKMLNLLYPNVPFVMINAGISGGDAVGGLERLERDVLRYSPDLCVVCFGLNDSTHREEDALLQYENSMSGIFTELHKADIETIFLTPNMMCTDTSCHIKDDVIKGIAKSVAEIQTSGRLEEFLNRAKAIAQDMGIPVCDCYAKWKRLYESGVNINELLANHINHPIPRMNCLFAVMLIETMFATG